MGEETIKITLRLEKSYLEFIEGEIGKKKKTGQASDRTDQIKIAIMQRRLSLMSDDEIEVLKAKHLKKEDSQDDLFSRKQTAPETADKETHDCQTDEGLRQSS